MKEIIATKAAPKALGAYSQAVKAGNTVYLSGQIPFDPETMTPVTGDIKTQIRQVFANLSAVTQAADGTLKDIVKLNVYLIDLNDFAALNEVMAELFVQPYPARAAVQVSALPKGAQVEIEGIMVID